MGCKTSKEGPELFIGLVGALGSDLERLADALGRLLATFDYEPNLIRLSTLMHAFERWENLPSGPIDARIRAHQCAGDELRETVRSNDAMAMLGIAAVRELRSQNAGDAKRPLPRRAFVFSSLKCKAEVEALRRVYGSRFVLLAAYAPLAFRTMHLTRAISNSRRVGDEASHEKMARELIEIDHAELGVPWGQRVRDTFPMADAFVDMSSPEELDAQLGRVLDLLFGHPFHTPTRHEYAMFQARAAALRSADLSRQVGATIIDRHGSLVAVGTNEVPRALGGQYWPGDEGDSRDFQVGQSSSLEMRRNMLAQMLDRLAEAGWLDASKLPQQGADLGEMVKIAEPWLNDSLLMSVGEFGRTVHAEMAALLDAARRGASVNGCSLYTTTFPCHNCTKHLVNAGIVNVTYIEPFPKSHAMRLHGDAIAVDSASQTDDRVHFRPFVGIAPRVFQELFTKPIRETESGAVLSWKRYGAAPRLAMNSGVSAYLEAEDLAARNLDARIGETGLRKRASPAQNVTASQEGRT